jgi:hypothetical protein
VWGGGGVGGGGVGGGGQKVIPRPSADYFVVGRRQKAPDYSHFRVDYNCVLDVQFGLTMKRTLKTHSTVKRTFKPHIQNASVIDPLLTDC